MTVNDAATLLSSERYDQLTLGLTGSEPCDPLIPSIGQPVHQRLPAFTFLQVVRGLVTRLVTPGHAR